MNKLPNQTLSAVISLLSFGLLGLIALATDPTQNVWLVILFLLVLFVFIFSSGYRLAIGRNRGKLPSPRAKQRLILLSIFLVTLVMLRSLGSFGVVEVILLCSLVVVSFFYIGRRPS